MGLATLALATVHFMSTPHISGVQALHLLATTAFPYGREIRFPSVGQQPYNIGLATSVAFERSAILLLVGETPF